MISTAIAIINSCNSTNNNCPAVCPKGINLIPAVIKLLTQDKSEFKLITPVLFYISTNEKLSYQVN